MNSAYSAQVDLSSYKKYVKAADGLYAVAKYDSAKALYDRSLNEIDPSQNIPEYVESRMGAANCELRLGHIAQASGILKELEKLHAENSCRNCLHIGPIYSSLSYCSSIEDDFTQAVEFAKKSIDANLAAFGDDDERTAASYYNLGLARKAMGNYPLAVEAFRHAIRIQSTIRDGLNRQHANALMMLGTVYDDINRFDSALVFYKRSMDILGTLGFGVSMEAATNHIYSMSSHGHLSNIVSAVEHGKAALAIYDSLHITEHANVASTCAKLAEIYFLSGDYDRSKKLLTHALEIYERKYPEKISAIGGYSLLYGELLNRSGETGRAIAIAEKGLKLYEAALGADHPQIGFRYETIAGIYFDAQRYGEALTYYRKALVVREKVNNSMTGLDVVALNSSVGNIFLAQQRYDSAQKYFNLALLLEQSLEVKNASLSSVIRKRSGDLAFALGKMDEAIIWYRDALSMLTGSDNHAVSSSNPVSAYRSVMDKKELIEILGKLGGSYEKIFLRSGSLGDLKTAQKIFLDAMDVIDDVRRQYTSDASKFFLARLGSSIYRSGTRVSVLVFERTGSEKFLQDAFLIADRSKGNVLLDRLADNRARKQGMIPDSLLESERALLERISYLEIVIPRSSASKESAQYSANDVQLEYFRANQQHQSMMELFERKYPQYYQSKYAKIAFSVSDVTKVLANGEALIEYMIDEDQVYIFALSKNSLIMKKVKDYPGTVHAAKSFTAALKTFDTQSYWKAGSELYSRLIKPIDAVVDGSSKLTIIPDGVLHSIPMEALPLSKSGSNAADFTTVEYLINRFEISYSYSAVFRLMQSGNTPVKIGSEVSFAGFAPVFKDSSKGSELFANRSFAEESGVSDIRSITLDGKKFNELKYSEDEIVSIERRMSSRSVSTSTFLFASATEHNFKVNAPNFDIIHIATHGFMNEQNPALSAVIFTQPDQPSSDDDGILYVNETAHLNLKAQLVVLSSCESGVGQFVKGEGMIALSRGLLYAGAQNVIFSLWKVSDKQTFHLMDDFYGNLSEGKGYAASLRAAKLSMIRSKESAFPGKWSGFVLIGQ